MKEQKEIKTEFLLSLTTRKLITENFSDIHEAAEFILGDSIFTHHFASEDLWKKLTRLILNQHPDLSPELGNDINPNNVWDKRDELIERLGDTRVVVKGNGEGAMSAFEGIPEGNYLTIPLTRAKSQAHD